MRSLVIFAGAGASRGLSSEKYPMALDFRARLPAQITSSPLFKHLESFISSVRDLSQIDIEHVLWELAELRTQLASWSNDSLLSYLLRIDAYGSIVSNPPVGGQTMQSMGANLLAAVNHLMDQINRKVYDLYSISPSKEELERTWLPLLSAVKMSNYDRVDIVTTNYDVIIEDALSLARYDEVETGRRFGSFTKLDTSFWHSQGAKGLLTKLHGSVDWVKGNRSSSEDLIIRWGDPDFRGSHDDRLILYPGFKGLASTEPFDSFHRYFQSALSEASHAIFIGFAFRDQHINSILEVTGLEKKQVINWNPTKAPALKFLKNAIHENSKFGEPQTEASSALPIAIQNWLQK